MKKIIAINCSPRSTWNTATLVREAAKGAEAQGAQVAVIDLYKLEKFTGCISCFGCKLPEHKKEHHETVFPEDKKKAFALGAEMFGNI